MAYNKSMSSIDTKSVTPEGVVPAKKNTESLKCPAAPSPTNGEQTQPHKKSKSKKKKKKRKQTYKQMMKQITGKPRSDEYVRRKHKEWLDKTMPEIQSKKVDKI